MPALMDAALIERCQSLSTTHISDSMGRLQGADALRPFHGVSKLAGTAVTVKVRPGDNLMIHKALDLASGGHVIVVDGEGDMGRALLGELMMLYARSRGIVGFVVDGAIRDVAKFREYDYPCFARGNTHRGPYKDGPGQINVPVCIDGMVVNPGDLVVGDEDGLLAIPAADAESVIAAAWQKAKDEERTIEAIANGRSSRAWVDDAIAAKTGGDLSFIDS
ncbi:RraA family protein [Neorhizobium galegae]|nr:RraA family protein [Neorhizobium galegae]